MDREDDRAGAKIWRPTPVVARSLINLPVALVPRRLISQWRLSPAPRRSKISHVPSSALVVSSIPLPLRSPSGIRISPRRLAAQPRRRLADRSSRPHRKAPAPPR